VTLFVRNNNTTNNKTYKPYWLFTSLWKLFLVLRPFSAILPYLNSWRKKTDLTVQQHGRCSSCINKSSLFKMSPYRTWRFELFQNLILTWRKSSVDDSGVETCSSETCPPEALAMAAACSLLRLLELLHWNQLHMFFCETKRVHKVIANQITRTNKRYAIENWRHEYENHCSLQFRNFSGRDAATRWN